MNNVRAINCPPQISATITAHYRKEGFGNILHGTSSMIKAPAILVEYE